MAAITYSARRGIVTDPGPGEALGCWCADTTAETLTGSELVTDGDMPATTNWSAPAGTSLSIVGGRLRVTYDSGASAARAYQTFSTVIGESYLLTVEGTLGTAGTYAVAASTDTSTSNAIAIETGITASKTVILQFTATSTTTYIVLVTVDTTATEYTDFDNASVRLAVPDITSNDNGLEVHGQITKSAVAPGAEMVAYSNFSDDDFLEQPYNADLDWGTGDGALALWGIVSSSGANQRLFIRGYHNGSSWSGSAFHARVQADGTVQAGATDDGYSSYDLVNSTSTVDDGEPHFIVFVISSGVYYIYIDGALEASTAVNNAASGLTNTSATLRFGASHNGGIQLDNGSIAAPRAFDYALTAAQIKSIYNSEKHLFEPYSTYTQVGESYSLDLDLTVRDLSRATDREVNKPIEGAHEVLLFGDWREFSVTSSLKTRAQVSAVNEFLTSALGGETFTFDPYGTTASEDTPLECQLDQDSFREQRAGQTDYVAVSFKVREVT